MNRPANPIDTLIQRIRGAGHIDRPAVEAITGAALKPTTATNSFQSYAADGILSGTLVLSVELREPKPGSNATAGPLLLLRIVKGCPARKDVVAHYAPLAISQTPRGGSLDEETSWSRKEPWGQLSFGFAERAPDCLSTVVFAFEKR
ncbi:hypothetical protein [Sphingomonas montana]|uniref:hypothetical protein n=1 Tax=Sphingomonas montana TaxID=1843236 RepID=UPI00096D92D3|nr:hypothetical protein [Sphingomonas montana]